MRVTQYAATEKTLNTYKRCAARRTIGQSDTVEQEGRGERAKQEIFHARLLRTLAPRDEPTQDIKCKRKHLYTDKDRQEACRRR